MHSAISVKSNTLQCFFPRRGVKSLTRLALNLVTESTGNVADRINFNLHRLKVIAFQFLGLQAKDLKLRKLKKEKSVIFL